MAISSYQVYLMKGSGTGTLTYAKLIDIKEFPDLFGTPELLETTTLSDAMKTYILGIKNNDALPFTANYSKADFTTLQALEGTETDYAVWFGAGSDGTPDGSNGKFSFKGQLSVRIPGGGVNEVVGMEITIAPTTEITFA